VIRALALFLLLLSLGCSPKTPENITHFSNPLPTLTVGEEARFGLEWFTFEVGQTVATVKEIVKVGDRDAYHIEIKNRSNKFLDLVFRIRDEYHTYLDVEDLKILRFEKKVEEGNYRAHEEIDFDHEKGEGYYHSLLNGSRKTFSINKGAVDAIGSIYKFRVLSWKDQDEIQIPVTWDEKGYDLRIPVRREGKKIRSMLGKIESFKVSPYIYQTDNPDIKASRIEIWLSRDNGRIPLKMRAKVPIAGSIYAVLREYKVPEPAV